MNNNVRKLTDGAMMCALVGVFLLINRQLGGLFEEMFLFIFPLPMVFYSAKYGMKDSWVVWISMVLLTVVVATPQTLFYMGSEAFLGMIYGSGVYKKTDSRKLLRVSMVVAVIVNMVSTVIYASFFGYDLGAEIQSMTEMMNEMTVQTGIAMPAQTNLTEYIKTILIVSVILTGVMQAFITHFLARLMLKRMRYDFPKGTPLAQYYPAKWTGYLGMLGMMAYTYSATHTFATQMQQNIFMGLGMCGVFYLITYGYIGLCVFMARRNPKRKKLAVLVGILAIFLFAVPLMIFGFLYITTDIHTRMLGGTSNA